MESRGWGTKKREGAQTGVSCAKICSWGPQRSSWIFLAASIACLREWWILECSGPTGNLGGASAARESCGNECSAKKLSMIRTWSDRLAASSFRESWLVAIVKDGRICLFVSQGSISSSSILMCSEKVSVRVFTALSAAAVGLAGEVALSVARIVKTGVICRSKKTFSYASD